MRHGFHAVLAVLVLFSGPRTLNAGDWPEWRGPERNGVVSASPALVEAFPEGGPVPVWACQDIPGDKKGGYGSVSVAGGKVYVLSHRSFRDLSEQRRINRQRLSEQGYSAGIPAEFSEMVETARVSEERLKITSKQKAIEWGEAWLAEHMKPEWLRYRQAALDRITGGPWAPPLDALAKLETVKAKVFAGQEELAAWCKENGISDEVLQLLIRRQVIDTTEPKGEDSLHCLNAETGAPLWKRTVSGTYLDWPASSTPTVRTGRVCWLASDGTVVCLSTEDGRELWRSEPLGDPDNGRNRSSSVLLTESVAVVPTKKYLVGLNPENGQILWTQPKVRSEMASAVVWTRREEMTILCSGSKKVTCLDLKTGEPIWSVRSASDSTPALVGEYMAFVGGSDEVGLTAYRLTDDKPKQLWTVPMKDIYTSPVIHDGYVYAIGERKRALCVELATGRIAWEEKIKDGEANLSSPIVADGKLIVVAGPWLYLIQANPEHFTVLGKASLGLTKWSSPAFVDGKLFVRTDTGVACYDLQKR